MHYVRIRPSQEPHDCLTNNSHFFKVTPRKVQHVQEFQRIMDRFQRTGNDTLQKPSGRPKTPAEKISAVKIVRDYSMPPSVSEIAATTSSSRYLTWKILRKDPNLHPFKPKLVQELTPEHKFSRK